MQRILITGVNGFVGNHLAKELVENDCYVVGVGGPDSAKTSSPASEYHSLDLTSEGSFDGQLLENVDGIIHLAGLAAVGPSFHNPGKYVTVNMGIEINLFEALLVQERKPRVLVVSSGSLYRPDSPLPLTEGSPVTPSSPYAVSKLGQEHLAQYYCERGLDVIIARPFNHIGPGQGTGFLVSDLASQVISCERSQTNKILVGNLDAKRDYTDVRDIARAYRLLLESGKRGELYNICSGESRSGHEILEAILREANVNAPVERDESRMRPSDTPDIYGSHEKLSGDTGWQPTIQLEQTIRDVMSDWRSR